MDRRLLLLVVVGLAALSGCSLLAESTDSGSEPEPEVTPANVPDVDAQAADSENIRVPGVYEGELTSATELARAHDDALPNRTFRVRESLDWTSTGAEVRDLRSERTAATWYRDRRVVRHERQWLQSFIEEPTQPRWTNTSTFRIEDDRFVRTETNGSVRYEVVPADSLSGRIRDNTSRAIQQLLALRNSSVETIEWNGESHLLITGRGSEHSLFGLANNYTARAVIQSDGLVRRLSVSYSESGLGRTRTYEYTMAIDTDESIRIERPDWVQRVRNGSVTTGGQ